jgi:hypothetical protein
MNATPLPPQNFSKKTERPEKRPYAPGRKVTRRHKYVGKRYARKKVTCEVCKKSWLQWRAYVKAKTLCSPVCEETWLHLQIPKRAVTNIRARKQSALRHKRYIRSPKGRAARRRTNLKRKDVLFRQLAENPRLEIYKANALAKKKARRNYINPLLSLLSMTKKAELANLTPAHTARIRGQIAAGVGYYLKMADEVMHGTRNWTPTQARVFSTLLNKVVPDLSASFVQHEHSTHNLRELSRDELERIARGEDAITVEYASHDHQSRETAPLLEPDPQPVRPGDAPARPKRGRPRKKT